MLALGALLTLARPWLDGGASRYVHVRWQGDVSAVERWWLEQRFALRAQHRDGQSVGYDLLDLSAGNVRALLEHPAVEDTGSFDRERRTVSPDAEPGDSRTGLAWRLGFEAVLPFLRPAGWLLIFGAGVVWLHALLPAGVFHAPAAADVRPRAPDRFVELDMLRGLAAMAVVLFHLTARFGTHYGFPGQPLLSVPLGFYGVHLFFVVSGMVIFLTIERSRSALDFIVARVGRLFPAYWVAATVTFLAVTAAGLPQVTPSTREYLWNLTMVQRFVDVADVDGVYWTLQVELAFYLTMLGLILCRAVARIEPILLAWLAVLTLDAATGCLAREGLETSRTQLISLYGYAPLFICGIALHLRRTRGVSTSLILTILWAAGLFVWRNPMEAGIVVAGVIAAVELAIEGRLAWLAVQPLLLLGAISYPLYLIHQNVGYVLLRAFYGLGLPTNAGIGLTIIVVLLLAALLHRYFERPGQAFARSVRARLTRLVDNAFWPV